jgi:hypothetical protein
MNMNRFNFFLYIICDAYNQLNIDNQLEYLDNNYMSEKSFRYKRNLEWANQEIFTMEDPTGYSTDTIFSEPIAKKKR